MVELIITILLVSIGIVGGMQAMSRVARAEAISKTKDLYNRLALAKYDELRATQVLNNTNGLSGDFTDQGHSEISWKAEIAAQTTVTDLYQLTVTVNASDDTSNAVPVSGLVYLPANTSSTGATN